MYLGERIAQKENHQLHVLVHWETSSEHIENLFLYFNS